MSRGGFVSGRGRFWTGFGLKVSRDVCCGGRVERVANRRICEKFLVEASERWEDQAFLFWNFRGSGISEESGCKSKQRHYIAVIRRIAGIARLQLRRSAGDWKF